MQRSHTKMEASARSDYKTIGRRTMNRMRPGFLKPGIGILLSVALGALLVPQVETNSGNRGKGPMFFNEHGNCFNETDSKVTCCNHNEIRKEAHGYPNEIKWCEIQKKPERCEHLFNKEEHIRNENDQKEKDEEELLYFLVVFLIIGYGAMVRAILRATGLPLPYTVILMLSGFGIGWISKEYCHAFQKYTAIARTPPSVILFTFLPVLIFESAFSIPVHTFMRSVGQLLIAAFPGMVISTYATAGVCMLFLREYNWSLVEASLFGAIISATDPVAVVAILRDLGTSEMLGVMIEGESLLNDGVAILMYKVYEEWLVCEMYEMSSLEIAETIILKFCIIALGGPAFGYLMARIAILCLSQIFNDATVEITITLAAAYLTYFIGDHILKVSGVMAVVALGLVMGSERTCISPEVEESVHHFWEMLGYLANTVLFVLVGIIISETAMAQLNWYDVWYLGFLYIALNIIRLLMLLLLMPILKHIGYGLKWENMIIMMWGGLRGAVGLCLAIEVFRGKLCDAHPLIGPQFLFQTAGIVVLTLVVNGTTTKVLLQTLKLTEVSAGRLQDMANATRQLVGSQVRTLAMLKHDRFLADANWRIVEKFTTIEDPYKLKHHHTGKERVPSIISVHDGDHDHRTECDVCHHMVRNDPTAAEFRTMTEEGRLRLIKALKVSYWRQFEQGVLTEVAVLTLVSVAETVEDLELNMIHAKDFSKYWIVHGYVRWLRKVFLKKQKSVAPTREKKVPHPELKCLVRFWKISNHSCFNIFIMVVIILNLIPIIWEIARTHLNDPEGGTWDLRFHYSNTVFTTIYMLEFIIKTLGLRKYYFKSVWNWIDILVLLISCVDVGLKFSSADTNDKTFSVIFKTIRFARLIRIVRLPRHIYPKLKLFIEIRTNAQLFLGYDIGKGFVHAIDDVLKFLPQMVDHPRIHQKLKHSLENERLETIRQMGLLQKEHPGIAIAVKTRHASRAILNQMREALIELKEDGLVDEKENEMLNGMIEHNMKRLWSSPLSVPPSPPHILLGNLAWVIGNDDLLTYLHENAEMRHFSFGDKICAVGDNPDGLYLIVSGMVKSNFSPTEQIMQNVAGQGKLPNTELFLDLTFTTEVSDFFSTGTCIGEIGALTGSLRASDITCETFVMAYHVSQESVETAFQIFNCSNDTLESRIWRAVAIKIGTHILPTSQFYHAWPMDKVLMHLDRSAVPIPPWSKDSGLKLPNFVSDVILVQGRVKNFHNEEIYTAPMLIPKSCIEIVEVENSIVPPRFLIVAHEEVDVDSLTASQASLHASVLKACAMTRIAHDSEPEPSPFVSLQRRMTIVGNLGLGGKGATDVMIPMSKRRKSIAPMPVVERSEIEMLPKMNVQPRKHHGQRPRTAHTAHHLS